MCDKKSLEEIPESTLDIVCDFCGAQIIALHLHSGYFHVCCGKVGSTSTGGIVRGCGKCKAGYANRLEEAVEDMKAKNRQKGEYHEISRSI